MAQEAPADSDILAAVSEVLQGRRERFTLIVERYQGLVYRLAVSYLGSREEAEDATQEVFLKVYAALGRFRLDRRFHPWLYTIAINHLRSRQRNVLTLRSRRVGGRDPDTIAAPQSGEADLDDARERIRAAVRTLPGGLREPVILYYLEGMDTAEVAEVMGVGVENVKSRLHRARAKLRVLLGDVR